MKRRILALLLLSAFPLLSFGQAMSLDECMNYAKEHNPDIVRSRLQYETQSTILSETTLKRVPVIGIGAKETFHTGNTLIMYGVDANVTMALTQVAATLEMPLITGGALPYTKKAEEQSLSASGQNITVTEVNMKIRVAAAYMQLLNDRSIEKIADSQVKLCQKQLENIKKLVSGGVRTSADLAEAKSALSSAEFSLTQAQGRTVISRISLMNLMGMDSNAEFDVLELEDDVDEGNVPQVLTLLDNIDIHPVVQTAKFNLASMEFREKASKGSLYPNISFFANYNNYFYFPIGVKDVKIGSQLGINGWGAFGITLSIPILDLSVKKRVQRAKLSTTSAVVALDESRKEVSRQVNEAYYQAISAKERYISAQKAEIAAKEAFDSFQKLFDAGRTTTYDLDRSRARWFEASQETVRSKYEYILRNKVLELYNTSYGEK